MRIRHLLVHVHVLAIGVVLLALPHEVQAQAWVGEPNSLSVSAQYSLASSSAILESEGKQLDDRPVVHHAFVVGADYVTPIEGLAINASLPMIYSKLDESLLDRAHGSWDDGDYHFAPTDFRLGLQYQFLEEPLGAAVTIGGSIPTNDYPRTGFVSPGRRLKQLHFGATLSKQFYPSVPRLHAHLGYEFSLVEKLSTGTELDDYGQNRSDMFAMLGYLIGDKFGVNLAMNARVQHGGVNFLDFPMLPAIVQVNHDPVLRERMVLVGGGGSYQVNDSLALIIALRAFVYGTNTRNASQGTFAVQYQAF